MAGAIKDLIELLLTEIAINGTDGASLAQVWEWVRSFHQDEASGTSNFVLDRALMEDLWQWLTLNPEVRAGRDQEYNGLALSEVELLDTESHNLRLFVSEDRTWRALTGHEKDETKVPASEFDLLSIVASCRSQGILQTDLVRRSGQDNRSVPKRTDALHTKGYIDKRQVQAKSAKTSLCVFSRFARPVSFDNALAPSMDEHRPPTQVVDVDSFAQNLFRVLRQHQIISRNDLKDELGLKDQWRWRILSKTVIKFEAIGCVRRVRARSQFHDAMKALHPCVLMLREPTDADMKLFKSDYKTLFQSIDQDVASTADQDSEDIEESSELQTSEHQAIEWTPDISVPNLIADIISRSGSTGRTNAQVIREGFGKGFRRPSENTLNRMSEGWQLSQPSHLKHGAIIRDTAQSGTITHYVHYTYPHFKELVDSGRTGWEAVAFRPRDARSSRLVLPPPDAPSTTDEDGLAPFAAPRNKTSERDIYCVVASKGLTSYSETKSDPIAIVNEEGQLFALFQREHGRSTNLEIIGESQPGSTAEEVPQDEDFSGSSHMQNSTISLGKMSKAERIEAELKKGTKTAKEVFANFGMDESWTHVAVRLMERPGPGVYLTSRGKARPAGKRQGRPKESRIAVFKSPTLVDFLKSYIQTSGDLDQAENTTLLVAAEQGPESVLTTSTQLVEEPPLSNQAQTVPQKTPTTSSKQITAAVAISAHVTSADMMQSNVQPTAPPDTQQSTTSETHKQSPAPSLSQKDASKGSFAAESSSTDYSSSTPANLAAEFRVNEVEVQTKMAIPKSRRFEKDGSVARERRNIVLTLIEQAGGAFPSSSELWHAFATVWIKHHKHSEKPDSRTVKSVVKYLVDAGKLRQLTFSGRGPKGEMVTRTLVVDPAINPTDPVVINLQEQMLKSSYFIPNNIEIDPEIAKIVRGGTGAPSGVYTKIAPVEPAMTVKLRNKPAFIIAQEKRREEVNQKRLLKPVRLMGIHQNGKVLDSKGMTSFTRPAKRKRLEGPIKKVPNKTQQKPRESYCSIEMAESTNIEHPLSQPLERALADVRRRRYDISAAVESPYHQFVHEIDYVSHWEMINQRAVQARSDQSASNLAYVHHAVEEPFEQVPIDGFIQFDIDGAGRRQRSTAKARRQKRSTASATKLFKQPALHNFDSHEISTQARLQLLESTPPVITERPEYAVYSFPPAADLVKPSIGRRRQKGLRDIGPQFVDRLRHAIVLVRIFSGGSYGKNVDWDLVENAFPRESTGFVRRIGKLLLNRDRRQLAQMQVEIRDGLLDEYRKPNCALPSINFTNMAAYDWDAVTTWATTQHHTPPTQEVPNLPGSRAHFEGLHEYRIAQPGDQFETIYTPNPSITIAKRESMYSAKPYLDIATMDTQRIRHGRGQRDLIDNAKCWILSNIIAKEETYNSVDAKQKLSRFPSDAIDEGTKELTRDRLIMQDNRGRVIPGRNFSLTDNFYHAIGRKRSIDLDMLKQAAQFKQKLDADFKSDGISHIQYDAVDGEVLAIMELAARYRVHISPIDPPSNPFGLTQGNYETRALDKAKYKFQMIVAPDSQNYEYGNPIREMINLVPTIDNIISDGCGDLSQLEGQRPPLWLDINGNLNQGIWQSVVSAVVGIVAIRPNIDAGAIHSQLQQYLAIWDIERTLAWLDHVGLVGREEFSNKKVVWRVKEYWWLVLDT
ncbi:hypothetical protein BGW36DRAFT_322197 [Talaromyces proteolyticus]|uniref:TFIIIC transcription initiation factor complex subunits Tfc3 n=1 Tax=Talaromyces proteolyticus TaxID=1131652 RepID=A0AAD4KQ81_9EURO|nr:uncharacterized protein BGW36DRAFT_322197 [Talaromyces proteolyticus]KAH8696730.1 hypothetical protein BGW36DRAFT_322197 [Talaromyces proteolyticus]